MNAVNAMKQDFMDSAWRDFIDFEAHNDAIIAEFNQKTGASFMQPGPKNLSAQVEADAFVLWVTENHWGLEFAPVKIRAAIEAAVAS